MALKIAKNKGKVYLRRGHEVQEEKQRYSSNISLTSSLNESGWLTPRPGRCIPGKETRYPLYRRLCGPQGKSGRVRKISPHRDQISGAFSPQQSLYRLSYCDCIELRMTNKRDRKASAAVELNSSVFWIIKRRQCFETDVSGLPVGSCSRIKLDPSYTQSRNVGFNATDAA